MSATSNVESSKFGVSCNARTCIYLHTLYMRARGTSLETAFEESHDSPIQPTTRITLRRSTLGRNFGRAMPTDPTDSGGHAYTSSTEKMSKNVEGCRDNMTKLEKRGVGIAMCREERAYKYYTGTIATQAIPSLHRYVTAFIIRLCSIRLLHGN